MRAGKGQSGTSRLPSCGLLPCDTVLFPLTVSPWALLSATLILFPLWLNTPTRREGASFSHFTMIFCQFQPRILPPPPVLPGKVFPV